MKTNDWKLVVDRLSFVGDELRLFLDTHPDNREALQDYCQTMAQREQAMKEYTKAGGAISAPDAAQNGLWDWTVTPWPWEQEG